MEGATTPRNLEELVRRTNEVGLEYVAARKVCDRLELMRSTEKARALNRHDDGSHSEAKLRRLAELDPEYIAFLEKLSQARGDMEKARLRYDSYKNLFEARRSMLSYQKAEMQLL